MKRKRYSIVMFAMLLFCAVSPAASMQNTSSSSNNHEDQQRVEFPAASVDEPLVVVDDSAPYERTALQQITDMHAEGNLGDLLSRGPGFGSLLRYSACSMRWLEPNVQHLETECFLAVFFTLSQN